jgi:hypothetical protein
MDEAQRSELADLRRRAYGPVPDPGLGDADLARLRELEARRAAPGAAASGADPRRVPESGSVPRASGGRHAAVAAAPAASRASALGARRATGPAADSAHRDPDAAPDAEPDEDSDADLDAAPRARPAPFRGRTAILWAASVLVAVGATVALSSSLGGAAGREVGVVALDPDRPVPERWDDWYQDAATGVGRFHGLTVIGLVNPEDDATCVTVVAPRSAFSGNPVGGCAAGDFPARGVLTVTDEMPADLREEFPEGTALEFVLDGMSVRVTAG